MSIPITRPFFDEQEREMILKPLESGWIAKHCHFSMLH
jgi:hypothetical protein